MNDGLTDVRCSFHIESQQHGKSCRNADICSVWDGENHRKSIWSVGIIALIETHC